MLLYFTLQSFAKVTTATTQASAVRCRQRRDNIYYLCLYFYGCRFTANVYTVGAVWRMKLNHDGNVLSLYVRYRGQNVTSSPKPEDNVLHCRQMRTEPRSQFRDAWTCRFRGMRPDRQTNRETNRNTSPPCEVIMKYTCLTTLYSHQR